MGLSRQARDRAVAFARDLDSPAVGSVTPAMDEEQLRGLTELLVDDCGSGTGDRVASGISLSSTVGACTGTCSATATTAALAKAPQTLGLSAVVALRASCGPDSRQPYDNLRGRVPSLIPSRQSRRQGQYFHHGMCPTTPPCATSM